MKTTLKPKSPAPGTIDAKEIRETFRNFSPGQLLTISATLTSLARQKLKSSHRAA